MQEKRCIKCGEPIDAERLEILPKTVTCVKCSTEKIRHDPNVVCAKASLGGQNGFSPKD